MRKLAVLVLIGLFVFVGIYLVLPTPSFPKPPPGSLVSLEPADTETVYRQSFFTNLTREEIMNYYSREFNAKLQMILNHPPEDAGQLIRDQTRSSYLEELVHPWKESLYVNGYVPTKPEEKIVRDGINYSSKITVHLIPSTPIARLTILLMSTLAFYFLAKEYRHV